MLTDEHLEQAQELLINVYESCEDHEVLEHLASAIAILDHHLEGEDHAPV